jgi:hypothetical protein
VFRLVKDVKCVPSRNTVIKISGYHGGEYEDSLLGYSHGPDGSSTHL